MRCSKEEEVWVEDWEVMGTIKGLPASKLTPAGSQIGRGRNGKYCKTEKSLLENKQSDIV